MRRSLKNRCAARVLLSPSRPNTWTKGALAVTTEQCAAETEAPPPGSSRATAPIGLVVFRCSPAERVLDTGSPQRSPARRVAAPRHPS